jgi:hypothetical protein
LTALGAACATPPSGPENAYVGHEGFSELELQEGNHALAGALVIQNVRSARVDGRLQVQLDLENRRSSRLNFEYAVEWVEPSGMRASAAWRWTPVEIGGGGVRTLELLSHTTTAQSFVFHVRPRNDVQ